MMEGTDLGMCFDIGHANTAGTIQDFLGYSDRFVNVHVHDNHGEWDEHLPVGEGNIDFRKVLQGLRGYKGRLVVESRSLMDAEISQERLTNMLGLSS